MSDRNRDRMNEIVRNFSQLPLPAPHLREVAHDTVATVSPQVSEMAVEKNSPRNLRMNVDIPEPPKIKEVIVPHIHRGPLFIKQEKFHNSLDLIDSLKDVIGGMQEEVYRMNETLSKDSSFISNLEGLVQEMYARNEELKGIISPK